MSLLRRSFCVLLVMSASICHAQIFGTVRGTVQDPQQAAIPNAKVTLKSRASAFTKRTQTDSDGAFIVNAVPAGPYTILIEREQFSTINQALNVAIGSAPLLKFSMLVSSITTVTQVTAPLEITNPDGWVSTYPLSQNAGRVTTAGSQLIPCLKMRVGSKRTYGMINIVPRSGFEFTNREAELTATYGSLHQTNDQLNFGGHSNRFAFYGSVTGNRTDLGLEPPTEQVTHNRGSGVAGFTTMNYTMTNRDQLRVAASLRKDHYQVPNTPENQAASVRDIDQEVDSFLNFSWIRALTSGTLLTISPLYHYNRAEYIGGPNDPLITMDRRASSYVGAQTTLGIVHGAHNFTAGMYGFVEHDDRRFQLADQTGLSLNEKEPVTGGVATIFLDEQFKPVHWLTLNGGVRLTHFSGEVNENAADPRIGVSIRVPKVNWVLRGFVGLYYQPPPLETIAGPVLEFALQRGIGFLPVRGERDQQHEFGVTMSLHGWTLDLSHFRTLARNFSDHSVVGNSNITLPLSIEHVTVRGWEAVVHSPETYRHLHFHLAYSNQVVKGQGAVVGGLTDFAPPAEGFFYIDHDQRDTLSVGAELTLPRKAWINTNINFGSGFLDGDGPQHLPSHTSADVALGKSFGDRVSVTFSALNVTNSRYLFGRDSSFAGTHYNEPRQFIGSVRYRFHF